MFKKNKLGVDDFLDKNKININLKYENNIENNDGNEPVIINKNVDISLLKNIENNSYDGFYINFKKNNNEVIPPLKINVANYGHQVSFFAKSIPEDKDDKKSYSLKKSKIETKFGETIFNTPLNNQENRTNVKKQETLIDNEEIYLLLAENTFIKNFLNDKEDKSFFNNKDMNNLEKSIMFSDYLRSDIYEYQRIKENWIIQNEDSYKDLTNREIFNIISDTDEYKNYQENKKIEFDMNLKLENIRSEADLNNPFIMYEKEVETLIKQMEEVKFAEVEIFNRTLNLKKGKDALDVPVIKQITNSLPTQEDLMKLYNFTNTASSNNQNFNIEEYMDLVNSINNKLLETASTVASIEYSKRNGFPKSMQLDEFAKSFKYKEHVKAKNINFFANKNPEKNKLKLFQSLETNNLFNNLNNYTIQAFQNPRVEQITKEKIDENLLETQKKLVENKDIYIESYINDIKNCQDLINNGSISYNDVYFKKKILNSANNFITYNNIIEKNALGANYLLQSYNTKILTGYLNETGNLSDKLNEFTSGEYKNFDNIDKETLIKFLNNFYTGKYDYEKSGIDDNFNAKSVPQTLEERISEVSNSLNNTTDENEKSNFMQKLNSIENEKYYINNLLEEINITKEELPNLCEKFDKLNSLKKNYEINKDINTKEQIDKLQKELYSNIGYDISISEQGQYLKKITQEFASKLNDISKDSSEDVHFVSELNSYSDKIIAFDEKFNLTKTYDSEDTKNCYTELGKAAIDLRSTNITQREKAILFNSLSNELKTSNTLNILENPEYYKDNILIKTFNSNENLSQIKEFVVSVNNKYKDISNKTSKVIETIAKNDKISLNDTLITNIINDRIKNESIYLYKINDTIIPQKTVEKFINNDVLKAEEIKDIKYINNNKDKKAEIIFNNGIIDIINETVKDFSNNTGTETVINLQNIDCLNLDSPNYYLGNTEEFLDNKDISPKDMKEDLMNNINIIYDTNIEALINEQKEQEKANEALEKIKDSVIILGLKKAYEENKENDSYTFKDFLNNLNPEDKKMFLEDMKDKDIFIDNINDIDDIKYEDIIMKNMEDIEIKDLIQGIENQEEFFEPNIDFNPDIDIETENESESKIESEIKHENKNEDDNGFDL